MTNRQRYNEAKQRLAKVLAKNDFSQRGDTEFQMAVSALKVARNVLWHEERSNDPWLGPTSVKLTPFRK